MTSPEHLLWTVTSVLLIDWPSRDVPDTLARAGYEVTVKGGPEPDNYSVYEVIDGEIVSRTTGRPPLRADLIYSHRPLGELPGILALGTSLGSVAVWYQTALDDTGAKDNRGCWMPDGESAQARALAEAAGLAYVDNVYIADLIRELGIVQ